MIRVIVDTREKTPFKFKEAKLIIKTLKTGDYALFGDADGLVIERKSVADLFSTLVVGKARFERELARMSLYSYPVIVVEGDVQAVMRGAWSSDAHGPAVLDHVLRLCVKYGVAILFCGGRLEAQDVTWRLLRAMHEVKTGRKI